MAGNISLESAIRTCKVDTAYANKVESDRFLNPANMVCPVWNGLDTTNRRVCADSFYTKSAGCNSAEDRVMIENNMRPQYMEYINLSANGISGSIYGNSMPQNNLTQKNMDMEAINKTVGSFGQQYPSFVSSSCGRFAYEQGMNQIATAAKNAQPPQQPHQQPQQPQQPQQIQQQQSGQFNPPMVEWKTHR
jgi:hypothetical protein